MVSIATFEILNAFIYISIVIIVAVFLFFQYKFRCRKIRGVPRVEDPVFPWGPNMSALKIVMHLGEYYKIVYDKAKRLGYKHTEQFLCYESFYFVLDPEYIKNILQRGFDHFVERGFYYNEKDDPLSANLFAIGGDKWRIFRKHLSPAFTPGKLKLLFGDMLRCAYQMRDAVDHHRRNKQPIEIQEICERYTTDVIGSCVFGLQCDSFKNPHSEFRKQGKKIFHFTIWRALKVFITFSFPNLSRRLGLCLFESDTTHFFINMVRDAMAYRKSSSKSRKDFLQLLLELQNDNDETRERPFSVEELTAQMFIFFAAGYETSSITMTFCLYELAINRDVQDRLRGEIHQVVAKNGGRITWDAIMDMKYMNQVVEETLRKYPPVSFITRACTKDYTMPGSTTVIEKGMLVFIPILGLHRDPEYYPDPDKFDPERFSCENRARIRPFTFLPFGEGPRLCIGMRFGLLQVKAGLAVLLNEYEFTLSDKSKLPLTINPFSFTTTPKENLFLDVAN